MFWTEKKIKLFSLLVLTVIGSHIFLTWLMDSQNTSLLRRGDFASFYSAGMIVRQGLGAQLYDTRLLSYVENLYWPSLRGNYVSFPYPPFTALFLAPFAFLPPQPSKFIFTVLMMALAGLAMKIGGRLAPVLKKNPLASAAFLLAFYPVSFGILGSQFTALNLFLYAGLLSAYSLRTRAGDFAAGLCLGFWFFKPQYALPILFFLMAARAWRIAAAACCVALVYYLLGTFVQGFAWPWYWLKAAGKAAAIDFPHNDFNMISIAGFFHAAGRLLGLNEVQAPFLNIAAWILSAVLFGGTGFFFWKSGKLSDAEERRQKVSRLLEISAPVLLLASPHALFYDLGICMIVCARYVTLEHDRSITFLILLTGAALILTMFKAYLPFSPMILYALGSLLFIVKNTNRSCRTLGIKGK